MRGRKTTDLLKAALMQLEFWQATADRIPGNATSMPFIEPSSRVIDEIRAAIAKAEDQSTRRDGPVLREGVA